MAEYESPADRQQPDTLSTDDTTGQHVRCSQDLHVWFALQVVWELFFRSLSLHTSTSTLVTNPDQRDEDFSMCFSYNKSILSCAMSAFCSWMLFQQVSGQPTLYAMHQRCSTCTTGGLKALFQGRNVRPLLIGSSLMLFQQITGQPSVLYYAAKIFKDAGFASDQDATRVSVVLGFFKLVMTGQPER